MSIQGTCYALFVYDVGLTVRMDDAAVLIAEVGRRQGFKEPRRAPRYEMAGPAPLRQTQMAGSLSIGKVATAPTVDLVLYEVGAVCVTYAIELSGDLGDLVGLSDALYDNETLLNDSRQRVVQLMGTISKAVERPHLSDVVEDYVMFEIRPPEGEPVDAFVERHRADIARVLRAERDVLSPDEVQDALSQRCSYRTRDLCIIDWFSALLIGDDMEDERLVLELASVELMELRLLDSQLDQHIERAYQLSIEQLSRFRWRPPAEGQRAISQMETDSALLFEGVSNAHKLLGDQYLARVYRVASARFHLSEWDAAIERKLSMLGNMYERLSTRSDALRIETLEWIIILLILFDIVMAFVPGMR